MRNLVKEKKKNFCHIDCDPGMWYDREKMRIILYTGKGGVGKTSLAAATSVRCSQMGYSTLVISTDTAHSLADVLGNDLSHAPREIRKNLFAQELDGNELLRTYWGSIQSYLNELLKSQGCEDIQAEELTILPGLEELLYILKLREITEAGEYDVVVLDCAPTGSTLRLLSFPDIFHWYMEKFFPLERKIVKAVRPLARRIARFPLPGDTVFSSIEDLYRKIGQTKKMLTDHKVSSVRLVVNPEKMVMKESQRAFALLNLFGFAVDAVIMNRIFPSDLEKSTLKKWPSIHRKYTQEAHRIFDPLPIFTSRFYEEEIVGIPRLSAMARHVFGARDPSHIFCKKRPMEFSKTNSHYTLSLRIPGIRRKELGLWLKDQEVIIQVKNYQRNILLPQALASLEILGAQKRGDMFRISFGKGKINHG